MFIEFSTIDPIRAKELLNQESFSYLTKEQVELILNNLGDFRVLDPNMYRNGKISFKNESKMIEFLKLGTHDPESFMFNCQYMSPCLELIKWGLDQGFKSYRFGLQKAVKVENFEIVDFYLSQGLYSKEETENALTSENVSLDFLLKVIEKYGIKIEHSWRFADYFSGSDLLTLIEKKILSHSSLKYHNREKYNEISRLKKLKK